MNRYNPVSVTLSLSKGKEVSASGLTHGGTSIGPVIAYLVDKAGKEIDSRMAEPYVINSQDAF